MTSNCFYTQLMIKRYYLKPARTLAILLTLMTASFTTQAEQLIMGYHDYPPYSVHLADKQGNEAADGMAVRVAKLIYDHLNLDVKWTLYPYARMEYLLRKGEISMGSIGGIPNPDDPDIYMTTELGPVPLAVKMIGVGSGEGKHPFMPNEFVGSKVIMKRGWPTGPYDNLPNMDGIKVFQVDDISQGIKMLTRKRAKYLISHSTPLEDYLKSDSTNQGLFNNGTLFQKELMTVYGFPIALSKHYPGNDELYKKMVEAYNHFVEVGKLDPVTKLIKGEKFDVEVNH